MAPKTNKGPGILGFCEVLGIFYNTLIGYYGELEVIKKPTTKKVISGSIYHDRMDWFIICRLFAYLSPE